MNLKIFLFFLSILILTPPSLTVAQQSKTTQALKNISKLNQTQKTLKRMEEAQTVSATGAGLEALDTYKKLKVIRQLEEIQAAQEYLDRFKNVGTISIKLKNSQNFIALIVTLKAEIDTSRSKSESLFEKKRDHILDLTKKKLSGLSDKALYSERKNQKLLKRVVEEINKSSERPFLINLTYLNFELE